MTTWPRAQSTGSRKYLTQALTYLSGLSIYVIFYLLLPLLLGSLSIYVIFSARMQLKIKIRAKNRKLSSYFRHHLVKSIPIGTVFSVYETLCDGLKDQDKVQGCYKNFKELLLKLAEFCLCK